MKERPILFSAPMVRAILAGTKSQTRRVVKPHFGDPAFVIFAQEAEQDGEVTFWPYRSDDGETASIDDCEIPLRCPYGQPGDRLWARETWAPTDGRYEAVPVAYRATDDGRALRDDRWRPSIHMPRWASRITLEITGVRVERLQDIGEADAMAEGIQKWPLGYRVEVSGAPKHESLSFESAQNAYRWLWDSINGPGSWDANPWVWVIEFRRVDA